MDRAGGRTQRHVRTGCAAHVAGVVVEAAAQVPQIDASFDVAYQYLYTLASETADGRGIEWIERTASGQIIHTSEPEVGVLRRMWVEFLSWLPIEWML